MKPALIPLTLVQFADFARTLTWKTGASSSSAVPVDLTGWSAELTAREVASSSDAILSISTTPSAQGSIALGGTAGTIAIAVPNVATASLPAGAFVYALMMISPTGIRTVLANGRLTVEPGTVRP